MYFFTYFHYFLIRKDLDKYENLNNSTYNQIFNKNILLGNKLFYNNKILHLKKSKNYKTIENNRYVKVNSNKIILTKPIPPCMQNEFFIQDSYYTPRNCSQCMEFLKIIDQKLYVCKNYCKIANIIKKDNVKPKIKSECRACIYFKRKQCFLCYVSPKDYLIKV